MIQNLGNKLVAPPSETQKMANILRYKKREQERQAVSYAGGDEAPRPPEVTGKGAVHPFMRFDDLD